MPRATGSACGGTPSMAKQRCLAWHTNETLVSRWGCTRGMAAHRLFSMLQARKQDNLHRGHNQASIAQVCR